MDIANVNINLNIPQPKTYSKREKGNLVSIVI